MSNVIDNDNKHSNLVAKIAHKYGMSYSKAKEIVTHQHRFTKRSFESNEFHNIKWPRLGAFRVNERRLKKSREKTNGRTDSGK